MELKDKMRIGMKKKTNIYFRMETAVGGNQRYYNNNLKASYSGYALV